MTPLEHLPALTALLRQCPAVTGKANGASTQATVPLPSEEAGWEQFITLAIGQGVGPLAASALLAPPSPAPPHATLNRLRAIQAAATQRALLQFGELLRVQARLQAEGIPMLFFKGQMLAQQAYGSINLRTCFDLDIFVHQAAVLRVKPLLAALGYRPEFAFLPHQEADLLRMECEYTFIREDGLARIDLQWQPRARHFSFPVATDQLWARHERVRLQGFDVDTFALDDLFLLLVAHGAKHTWNKLEQVCALAALIHRNPGLNWPDIERSARAAGAERMLFVAVNLVCAHFHAPVPDALRRRAATDAAATALAAEFASGWLLPLQPQSLPTTVRRHLRMRERVADRLRYCFWLAVTPTPQDWLEHPFPPGLHWAHYLLRPWRLACKYARVGQGS